MTDIEIRRTLIERISFASAILNDEARFDEEEIIRDISILAVYTRTSPILDVRCAFPTHKLSLWLNIDFEECDDDRPGLLFEFKDLGFEERLWIISKIVEETLDKLEGEYLMY